MSKNTNRRLLVSLFAAGALISVLAPITTHAQGAMKRLAAQFKHFDFSQANAKPITPALPGGAGGTIIYQRTVTVPVDANTLYVTVSGGANTHDGAALLLACQIDSPSTGLQPCNAGQATGTPSPALGGPSISGWIALQKHFVLGAWHLGPVIGDGGGGGGDMHNNNLHYEWCARATGGEAATVTVRMASTGSDDETEHPLFEPEVFMEGIHFFIDASEITNPADRCAPATP